MTSRVPQLLTWGVLVLALSCWGEPTAPEYDSPLPSPEIQADVTGGGGGGQEGTILLTIPSDNGGPALAVICAENSGEFAAVHERLFADDDWQGATPWGAVLATAGVADTTRLVKCIGGESARARLDRDLALAQLIGVSSTPAFVVPSGVARGLQTPDGLQELLR